MMAEEGSISRDPCPDCGVPLARHGTDGTCLAFLLSLARREGGRRDEFEAAASPGNPHRFGDYELLEVLAKGGMGVVWRARQLPLNRLVALKMIRGGHLADEEAIRRFRIEAETVARLDHPNIVPIYDVGELEGFHYFTMKLVEGHTLVSEVACSPELETSSVAALLATVARAVHHAHQHGVIHRDLKPANILINGSGEPQVTDFGIAKLLRSANSGQPTLVGQAVGTPEYMSPEQASGQSLLVSTSSDIYALGAILYALLGGRPPVERGGNEETHSLLRRIIEEEPPPLRRLNPKVDADLATVCHKCLEKEPHRRYASALDLANDLDRWGRGEPIRARPSAPTEWVWKWVRRHRALAALSGALILLSLLTLLGLVWHARQTDQLNSDLNSVLLRSRMQRVEDLFSSGNTPRAMAELVQIARGSPGDSVVAHRLVSAVAGRRFARPCLPALTNGQSLGAAHFSPDGRWVVKMTDGTNVLLHDSRTGALLAAHSGYGSSYDSISFSPDGRMMATGLEDGRAIVWEPVTGRILSPAMRHGGAVEATDFSPDGRRLVTGSRDSTARIWSVETGEPITPLLRHRARIRRVRFSPDGRRVATASNDGTAQVWDARTGAPIGSALKHEAGTDNLAFSPDGLRLITASRDATARIWETESGRQLGPPLRHADRVRTVAFTSDGELVATSSTDGTARIWNSRTGEPLTLPLRHRSDVRPLAFSPDGRFLLTGSHDTTAHVWDARTGARICEPVPASARISDVEFHPDGTKFLVGDEDGRVQVWELPPQILPIEVRHNASIVDARFCPDGASFAIGGRDGGVQVWSLDAGLHPVGEYRHQARVFSLMFDRSGQRLLTASEDGTARSWDVAERRLSNTYSHDARPPIYSAKFSPNGQWAITTSEDRTARVWSLTSDAAKEISLLHPAPVVDGQFSPDSRWVVTACDDWVARLWEVSTGRLIGEGFRHDSKNPTACFSSDGNWILTASLDKTARLWDARNPQNPPVEILRHSAGVRSAVFSPDDRRILTRGFDNTVSLWSKSDSKWHATALHHENEVTGCAFSPDSRSVATACSDGFARVWDASTGLLKFEPLRHPHRVQSAEFSPDGRRLLTAAGSMAFVWELPNVETPLPDWFLLLAETLGGSRNDEQGGIQKVSTEPYFSARAALGAGSDSDALIRWAKGFMGLPLKH